MGKTLALRKILIGLVIALTLAIIGTIGSGIYLLTNRVDNTIQKIGASGPDDEVTETQVESSKPITMLLLGIDNRKETGTLNSDVIMLAALNPVTNSATIVSLPRDFQMNPGGKLPSRKANFYYPYFYMQNKSTVLKNSKQIFGDFFQVPIDAAVTVDFDGFRKAIDELGGVTVDVSMNMRYVDEEDGTNINLKKGVQTLNGQKALDYVRYRKSNMGTAESNDHERNERQHEVIDQMISKVVSLGGVLKLGQLMDVVGDHVKTDIPSSKLKDFFSKYIGIDRNKIEYISLSGEWVSPYVELKQEDIEHARDALQARLNGTAGEPATSQAPAPSKAPQTAQRE